MSKEILKRVNKIIKEEGGKSLKQNSLLKESELDSFAYTFFYYSLVEEFALEDETKELNKYKNNKREFDGKHEELKAREKNFFDFIDEIDYETFKVKDLITKLEQCIK